MPVAGTVRPTEIGASHARSRHRLRRPLAHRPRQQGLAEGPASRRPGRDHRPGRAGEDPRASTRTRSTTSTSAADCPAASPASTWPASSTSSTAWTHVPGATVTRYCSSSVQTTRMAFHAIKAGEGDVFISAGVETVSRFAKGTSDHLPDTQNPLFDDAQARTDKPRRGRRRTGTTRARTASSPTSTSRWARPPRTSPRCAAWTASELDEFGVRSQNLAEKAINDGFWAREITPVTTPDGTVVTADDGPRAGVTYEAVSRAQAGLPPRRRGHGGQLLRPQRRRRRGRHHVRHQGRRARPDPAGPDRLHRRQRALPGDHGPRPGRGHPPARWPTPA